MTRTLSPLFVAALLSPTLAVASPPPSQEPVGACSDDALAADPPSSGRRSAPRGGLWSLARTNFTGATEWTVTYADGSSEFLPPPVGYSSKLVFVGVPDDAIPGDAVLTVDSGSPPFDVVVGNSNASSSRATTVSSLELGVPVACELVCGGTENYTLPPDGTAAVVVVGYSGGPALLDVWALPEGETPSDEGARVIDSVPLENASEGVVSLRASDYFDSADQPLDIYVRLRDPTDLSLLAEATLFTPTLGESPVVDTEGLSCNVVTGGTGKPNLFSLLGGCSSTDVAPEAAPPFAALAVLFLFMVRRRRR